MKLLVKHIGTIVGIERQGRDRLSGVALDQLDRLDAAWLTADDGRITAFGTADKQPDETLPTYKHIKIVELRATEFEKTTSRKIKRHLLK